MAFFFMRQKLSFLFQNFDNKEIPVFLIVSSQPYFSGKTASVGIRAQQDSTMGDRSGCVFGNPHRNTDRGNEDQHRNLRDVEEIERLQQRVRDLEAQEGVRSEEET